MDQVTIIVTALAAGAAALRETASETVKDAYQALKTLLDQHGVGNLDLLEGDPKSETRQAVVREALPKTEAVSDKEVLHQAKAVLDLIQNQSYNQYHTRI